MVPLQKGTPPPKTIRYHQLTHGYRSFSSLPTLRPTVLPSTFRTSAVSFQPTPSAATTEELENTVDRWPKISSHPGLATTQVRYAPRNTFSPSHFVRKRRHGFLSRIKTRKGRATIQRRKSKRRSTLSHWNGNEWCDWGCHEESSTRDCSGYDGLCMDYVWVRRLQMGDVYKM